MSEKRMAACLTVSEIQRQKWSGGSFHPPLAGIRVKQGHPRTSCSDYLYTQVMTRNLVSIKER